MVRSGAPQAMDDDVDLAALEATAWAEFQASLDRYIAEWAEHLIIVAGGEPLDAGGAIRPPLP